MYAITLSTEELELLKNRALLKRLEKEKQKQVLKLHFTSWLQGHIWLWCWRKLTSTSS